MLLSRGPVGPCSQVTTATKPSCSLFESHNFNATSVTMPRQFCHLPGELSNRDRPPAVIYGSDTMEHENVPAPRPHPGVDILSTVGTNKIAAHTLKIRLADETTVDLEWVYWILQRIVSLV